MDYQLVVGRGVLFSGIMVFVSGFPVWATSVIESGVGPRL